MLILYLEHVGQDSAVDFADLLTGSGIRDGIVDTRMFLKDSNNWVPYRVVRDLIRAAEEATGNGEIAYQAARNYFEANRAPSLVEIIARLLNDMEQILVCSSLWAEGYTNYLKLQCLASSSPEDSEIVFLSQFGLGVEPTVGNIQLIRGNYEGFTRLFPAVERASCVEEISQVKLETLVREFPDYGIEPSAEGLLIRHRATRREVVTAVKVALASQSLPSIDNPCRPDRWIVEPHDGTVTVPAPFLEPDRHRGFAACEAYQIVDDATLERGPVHYLLSKGQLFDAPYSRFRFHWTARPGPDLPAIEQPPSLVAPLLFDHLQHLRETQRRLLQHVVARRSLTRANEQLRATIRRKTEFFGMIGRSKKMLDLFDQARRIGPVDSTVLIVGETGTGKELLARAIHQLSGRAKRQFFAVNCAALAEGILESELFGHEKGAFTGAVARKKGIFETAHGCTLFLDEVGDISAAMQAKLLRVLEHQEFQRVGGRESIPIDVRIIAATNRELTQLVGAGDFRADLFYRLNVITLRIPPLREHADDLPQIAEHYLDAYSQKYRKEKPTLTPEALERLQSYRWPGNIRELNHVIERAVVLDWDQQITPEDLVFAGEEPAVLLPKGQGQAGTGESDTAPAKPAGRFKPFHEAIGEFRRSIIQEALDATGGNQTQAARLLGLHRTYLVRLIRLLGISTRE
jgi:DNA-binding NtrC family response regulator